MTRKQLGAGAVFVLLGALPRLAWAGEGKEGFVLMLLLGAAGAGVLLLACVGSLLLLANLARGRTLLAVFGTVVGLAWGAGTYSCFYYLLNPVWWFFDKGMGAANSETRWHSGLLPWLWADAGCAGLAALLAWWLWRRRQARLLAAENEALLAALGQPRWPTV